ncbi:MAG: response regulator [FCB group bacterium]|nr:response regulator [FCB group bacterium]
MNTSSPNKSEKVTSRNGSIERPLLALDALSKLTRQFVNKPEFNELIHTLLLTLSGQFTVSSAFAIMRRPGAADERPAYLATGKYTGNMLLESLLLSADIERHFLENNRPCMTKELDLPETCGSFSNILRSNGVVMISPLVHNDSLLGIIGMGEKVTRKQMNADDIVLYDTLLNSIIPLVANSYQFWEVAKLGSWYLDILNNVRQGVFAFSADNRLKKINSAGLGILKHHNAQIESSISLVNRPLEDIFPEDVFGDWARRIIKAITENKSKSIDGLVTPGSENVCIYDAYLSRISDDSDYQADYIITLDDITERIRAEEALRLMQFSIDHISDSTFWSTPEGQLCYVNDTICQNLGYSREELLKMSVTDIDPIYNEGKLLINWEDIKREKYLNFESVHRRISGEDYPVEVTINYVKFEGDEYCCIFARDISQRKETEDQQQQLQQKLDRAEKMEAIGVLAGGVAHDLNNMLGPLVGYPDLILRKLPEGSKIRSQIQKIGKSAQNAADIVGDLLTLARRGRYEMKPISLNDVVDEYLESPNCLKLQEDNPGTKLIIKRDPKLNNIMGSTCHLSKVIMNLIVNAFDATPDNGELTIETSGKILKRLADGYDKIKSGEYALLSVRDTGEGIAEEDIKRIFEPYYSKKKMGASGSGLGLAIVYGIIKDHGGYYDIVSKVGKGTEFILYFPVTEQDALQEELADQDWRGSETVLVVDDDKEQQELTFDLLTSLGYSVNTADNGREAVNYLSKSKADMVVLDMIMENDFDGLDTFQEIIKYHPQQKAIIVSGFSVTGRVTALQKMGVVQFLRKPFTLDVIAKALREELDRPPTPKPQ